MKCVPAEAASGREQSVEPAVADLTLFQGMVAEYLLNQSAPQCMISGSKGEYTNSDKDTKTWLDILKTG